MFICLFVYELSKKNVTHSRFQSEKEYFYECIRRIFPIKYFCPLINGVEKKNNSDLENESWTIDRSLRFFFNLNEKLIYFCIYLIMWAHTIQNFNNVFIKKNQIETPKYDVWKYTNTIDKNIISSEKFSECFNQLKF